MHNYPIGTAGRDHASNTKGNKYNVIPVKREFLSGIRAYVYIDGNHELEAWIMEGLYGNRPRLYGLPFLGDNSFLIDRLEPVQRNEPVWWYEKIGEEQQGIRENITRLTTTIDRAHLSQTRSLLFAPSETPQDDPPETAWVQMP